MTQAFEVSSAHAEILMKIARFFGGEDAVNVMRVLMKVDEIKDEDLALQSGVRLNSARKVLYKLYDHSLVTLRRVRDTNSGWIVFYWRLQPDQLEGFILNQKRRILEKLETRLEYEKNHDFYYCNTPGCRRVPFEEAIETLFRCPTCNKPLTHFKNAKIIEVLTKRIEQLRGELEE